MLITRSRLMSDYEVNLVNDSMQEFYVMFNGPEESKSIPDSAVARLTLHQLPLLGVFGRSTSSCPTNILTKAPALGL